jgi:hypothetical protein
VPASVLAQCRALFQSWLCHQTVGAPLAPLAAVFAAGLGAVGVRSPEAGGAFAEGWSAARRLAAVKELKRMLTEAVLRVNGYGRVALRREETDEGPCLGGLSGSTLLASILW